MKRTLLVTLGLLATMAGLIAVAAWEPWASREREHELAWITAFAAWSDRIDAAVVRGDAAPATCAEDYTTSVGDAPKRLAAAAELALDGCDELRRSAEDWYAVRHSVLADLTDRRARVSAPARSAELARAARLYAAGDPVVLCWSSRNWVELSEEWALISIDELWPIGFADPDSGRIHLAPQICDSLHRFFGGDYAPNLNEQSLDLAIALVTLAHEAEHLRSPNATEAEVECVAMQRVRDFVRDEGRAESYVDLMAGLALDVSYPNVPSEYRTDRCRDGGELDVRPGTSVWP